FTSRSSTMRVRFIAIAFLTLGLVPGAGMAADLDRAAVSKATRDFVKQFNFLQEVYVTQPQLFKVDGLYQQTVAVQNALADFQSNVWAKASAEQLAILYDAMDQKLTNALAGTSYLEKEVPILRQVRNRMRQADNELHLAVFGGSGSSQRQTEKLVRGAASE